MGGGHVMRCLALADAIKARGGRCTFLCGAIPESLGARVRASGHALVRIEPLPEAPGNTEGWEGSLIAADDQRWDAQRSGEALPEPADWMVVDHYRLDHRWQSGIRSAAGRVMVIDDLANRTHDCDMLVDPTFGRDPADYAALVASGCAVLVGALYAPLRPEFAAARPAALVRRSAGGRVERILVSLGTTDVGGITAKVLAQILETGIGCAIDVVIGVDAPSLPAIERLARADPQLHVHVDSRDIAALMANADIAVGAAGTTSWERCCLGLPTLTLVLADNQRFIAEQLERAGAHQVVSADTEGTIKTALLSLVADEVERMRMAEAAAHIADGLGCDRICAALYGEPLRADGI